MPVLRTRKNCNICKAVKADNKLLKRIYKSAYYTGKGETMAEIAKDAGLSYDALRNHCRYHQGLTDDDLTAAKTEAVAKKTANQLIETNVATTAVRQDVIDMLNTQLKSADLSTLDAKDVIDLVLKATKHADDVKAKAKDQNIDVMRIMASARSGELPIEGEVVEPFDPWKKQIDAN